MKDTLKLLAGSVLLFGFLAYYFATSAIRAARGLPPTDSEEDAK
jgi:hypothetical protein